MSTRRVTGLASIGVAVAVLSAGAMPAAADGSVDVLLSADGIVFSTTPSDGILDPFSTLVPGASIASVLWIRNPTDTPAAVRVSATRLRLPSRGFADDVTVTTSASQGGGTHSSTLAALSECEVLVPSQVIEGGATMRLDLGFAMSADARSLSQRQRASLSLLVAMRDADAGAFAASACDDDGTVAGPNPAGPIPAAAAGAARGGLASTGADLPVPLITIGALLLGAGFFLLGAGRRKRSRS